MIHYEVNIEALSLPAELVPVTNLCHGYKSICDWCADVSPHNNRKQQLRPPALLRSSNLLKVEFTTSRFALTMIRFDLTMILYQIMTSSLQSWFRTVWISSIQIFCYKIGSRHKCNRKDNFHCGE